MSAQVASMSWWGVNVRTGAVGVTREDMEQWAGGNPTWNFGVDYRLLLTRSSELGLVEQGTAPSPPLAHCRPRSPSTSPGPTHVLR
ncbi:hypothetical protein ACFQ1S_02525 [Kibdelosporangium lantanae]|uniref:Uncharacterized protein n=1 Tax=Kibdelosporangium lantanae TaxID=1497396 RepID=A0ABW3M6E3_9PSEU